MKYEILFRDIVFSLKCHTPRLFLWPENPSGKNLSILYDMGIWNGCNVFIREPNKILVFSFSGSIGNREIKERCNNNQDKLFKFIHTFLLRFNAIIEKRKPLYIPSDIKFFDKSNAKREKFELESGIILSAAEFGVSKLLINGYSAPYIAEKMNVSQKTIEAHIYNMKNKYYDKYLSTLSKQDLIDFLQKRKWVIEAL